jgi:Ca-activated chloride channel family protein
VFTGVPVVVTGRFTGVPTGAVELVGDGGWRHRVEAVASDNPSLTALWARARVRDLEDRYVVGSGDQGALERRIVETSLEFGVLSRFTAFVAVDERVVNESGHVHRVTQPVETPDGWAGPPSDNPFQAIGAGYAGGGYGAPPSMQPMSAAMPNPTAAPPGRLRRTRGPAPAGRPKMAEEGQQPPVDLDGFLTGELAALRAVDAHDPERRAAALTRLCDQITRHRAAWLAAGKPAETLRALDDLVARLATPTTDPAEGERRLRLAITTLESLTAPRKRPFWKR